MSKRRTRRERGKNKTAQLLALTTSLRKELVGTQRAVERFRQEAREARGEAMRAVVRDMAGEMDFTKHMLRAASVEIGRRLGSEISGQLRNYDDVFAERRKIADSLLSLAKMGVAFDAQESAVLRSQVIRISLPPIYQAFAIR